jgi:hypothetical protein
VHIKVSNALVVERDLAKMDVRVELRRVDVTRPAGCEIEPSGDGEALFLQLLHARKVEICPVEVQAVSLGRKPVRGYTDDCCTVLRRAEVVELGFSVGKRNVTLKLGDRGSVGNGVRDIDMAVASRIRIDPLNCALRFTFPDTG